MDRRFQNRISKPYFPPLQNVTLSDLPIQKYISIGVGNIPKQNDFYVPLYGNDSLALKKDLTPQPSAINTEGDKISDIKSNPNQQIVKPSDTDIRQSGYGEKTISEIGEAQGEKQIQSAKSHPIVSINVLNKSNINKRQKGGSVSNIDNKRAKKAVSTLKIKTY